MPQRFMLVLALSCLSTKSSITRFGALRCNQLYGCCIGHGPGTCTRDGWILVAHGPKYIYLGCVNYHLDMDKWRASRDRKSVV